MRITGGTFRSRLLAAPRGSATRPTSDRVREGLFGILTAAGELEGARVLDLYAGTGALGLEALAALRKNVATLGVEALARVIAAELGSGPSRASVLAAGPFDLVLVDP